MWLADGTPVGEDEAMRTFAARLGLDPVLDLQALEPLTLPDPGADARARLLGLIAVLARDGLALPTGIDPGRTGRPAAVGRPCAGAETVEWSGWRDAVRAELDAVEGGPLGPWLRGPKARCWARPSWRRGCRWRCGGCGGAAAAGRWRGRC